MNGHAVPHTPGAPRPNHRLTDATMVESPQTSPARPEHDISSLTVCVPVVWSEISLSNPINGQSQIAKSSRPPTTPHASELTRTPIHRSHSQSQLASSQQLASSSNTKPSKDSKEALSSSTGTPGDNQLRSFKVSIEDPCWKVLPAALKKYKINDDWRKYVMFICHGSTGPHFIYFHLYKHAKGPLTSRTLSELRRKTSSAFSEAQGREQKSCVHASAYQGHPVTYRSRSAKAGSAST